MQHLFFSRPIHLLTRVVPLLAALAFAPLVGWGQTTIGRQNFETTPATPTIAVSYTGSPATQTGANGGRPTGNKFSEGTQAIGKSNGTATIVNTTAINFSAYTSVDVSFRLAGFSVNASNGIDGTDLVTVEISRNNGTSFSSELTVAGSGANQYWDFTSTGNGTTAWDGNGTPTALTSSTGAGGLSTIKVTGITPATSNTQLIFRITLLNNDANELWVVDDIQVTGTTSNTITAPVVASGLPACVTAATGGALGNITFTSAGAGFTGSVTYTAQLSDASGSFASPVTLGSVTNSAGPGAYTITGATVPANTASGAAYAVRVVTTSPAVTGSSLTAQTIARYTVAVTPSGPQTIPVGGGGGALLTAAPAGSGTATVSWHYATMSGGATTPVASAATGTTYTPTGTDFPGAGTYFLVARSVTTGTACGTTQTVESNEVTINVSAAPVITASTAGPLTFNALAGAVSAAQTYTVSGASLTGTTGITVTPPTGYEIAFGAVPGTYFTTAQVIAQTSANTVASTTVNVRLTNAASGTPAGNVTNVSTGATQKDVAVTGTVVAEPTTAPTVSAGTPGATTVTLTIGGGNGTKRLVIVRPAADVAVVPTDQITYAANLAYGTVATNSTTGTNNFVIVAGTATTANITGLTSGVNYVADVYAYNEGTAVGFENYFTTSGTPATFTTTTAPVVLVRWDFPGNPDDAIADGGIAANNAKTISTVGGTSALTFTTATNTSSARATTWDNGNGSKYWQVDFVTTGYASITLSSKQRGSNSGPRDFKLQYRIGTGGAWTDVTNVPAVADDYTSGVLTNVALPAAANNQPQVFLRWIMTSNTSVNASTVASGGAGNIDDIVVNGVLSGNSISATSLTPSSVCVSSTATGSTAVAYTTSGTFTGTFTAEVSDNAGSFTTPLATATGASPITLTIPAGTAAGSGYLVRVTNPTPSATSNTLALTITNSPAVPTTVKQGATPYLSGGTAYAFPATAWGTSSSAVTFTIENAACAILTLGTLTTTGPFTVTQPLSGTVATGSSTTFTATYVPTALGSQSGTVQIPSDDPAAPYVLNLTGTGSPSNLSDVITSASVTYNTTGIDYASKQGATVTSSNNTLNESVYRITVRDGGGAADADNLPTILDGLTLNITQGAASIRAASLFNGTGLAGQGVVAGSTITFSNLISTLGANVSRVTAADGGSFDLILRVTFTTTATDGQQLRFSVANASAAAGGSNTSSTFITTGTATSTTTAGSNELNVIATKLVYSPAVVTTGVVNADFGVTVVAQDALNNPDTDFKSLLGVVSVPSVTLTRGAGTGTFSSALNPTLTKTLTGGTAAWTDVRYDVVENSVGLLTTNTGGLTNASTTINFIAFGGHLWVGASGGSWYVASNWSKNTVPTSTDDVRLDNSSVSGSYSVSIATPNSAGGTALAKSLQVGYAGNVNTITLNITGGGCSVDDNLRVGPAGGTALLIADGGVVSNATNASGAGNTGLDFASATDIWEMTGTGTYIHNQTAGVYPTLGTGKATFAATSTFEVKNTSITSNWLTSGLGKIKTYGNLKLTTPSATVNLSNGLAGTPSVGDSLTVLGDMTLTLGTVRVALVSGSTDKDRIRVKGNLIVNGGSLYVADGATDTFNQIAVEGNVTTQGTGLIAGGFTSTDKGRFVIGGSFTGIYNSNTNTTTGVDELVFQGGTAPVSVFTQTSGTLRFLTIKKSVQLGAGVSTSKDIIVAGTGTLDFNFFNTAGSGVFTLQAGGTLKITDPAGITAAAATPTGNVRGTGLRTFPNGATYWYTGTVAQLTGTGLPTTNGTKNIICDNPTTLTPTASASIQSPGRLEIKQGTFIETAAEISGTGDLTMSGGTYRLVKGVASSTPPELPQLTGAYALTGGAIELAGSQIQGLRSTATGIVNYNKLRFKNAGTKLLSSAIANVPDSVVITAAAILDLTQSRTGAVGSVDLSGTGGLLMTGTSRLKLTQTGVTPGMGGVYTLTGGAVEFANTGATQQTIRGNEVSDPTRTYFNIDVTGSNVGASIGNFAIGTGGTMTVKNPSGSFSMTDQAITGAGSFVLESGATFKYGATQGITTFATGGTGTSAGNIRVSGARTFAATANYVVQGTGNTVTGDGLPTTVASLTVNKPAATDVVTLTSPVTTSTALTLTQGILSIGNNDVTLASAATLTGGSVSSYIRTDPSPTATGKLTRTVDNSATSIVFPVGTSTYTPATVSQTAGGTTDVFSVRVFDGLFKGGTTGTAATDHGVNRTWMIDEGVLGGSNATLTLQWNAADELTAFTRPDCRIGHYLTGIGYDRASASTGPFGIAGGSDPYTRSRTGITSFSPFAVGDAGGVLPVELTAFTALAVPGKGVQLNWATASERNSDRFEVQRNQSADAKSFVTIGTLPGYGTTSAAQQYAYLDRQAPQGVSYYRLRQVDRDGAENFSEIKSVKMSDGRDGREVTLHPVPATSELSISHGPLAPGARLTVYDALGRSVLTAPASEAATADRLDVQPLPTGVYRLVLTDGANRITKSFVKGQ